MDKKIIDDYVPAYEEQMGAALASAGIDPKNISHKYGFLTRMIHNIQPLVYLYSIKKAGDICICFRAQHAINIPNLQDRLRLFEDIKVVQRAVNEPKYAETIIGYMHSHIDQKGKIGHEFVCYSSTFNSQDGEYRNRLISFASAQWLYNHCSEVFAPIEAMIVAKMESKKLRINHDIFMPHDQENEKEKIEKSLRASRIDIMMFSICWFIDYYRIRNRLTENHMNDSYKFIFSQADDLAVFEKVSVAAEKYGGYDKLINGFSRHQAALGAAAAKGDKSAQLRPEIVKEFSAARLGVGQKIIPMMIKEAYSTKNVIHNSWRELTMQTKSSALVINGISPCFSVLGDWFYLENTSAAAFENNSMHEKYRNSAAGHEIARQLSLVDLHAFVDKNKRNGPIDRRFKSISDTIENIIFYINTNISIIPLSICITSEYVDKTVRDILGAVAYGTDPVAIAPFKRILSDPEVFHKHMFEFVYSLLCLNEKLGIVHGDLHINNATIRRYMHEEIVGTIEPTICYQLGGKVYSFPHYGTYATIIDFSRSIMSEQVLLTEYDATFTQILLRDEGNLSRIYGMFKKPFDKLPTTNRKRLGQLIQENQSLFHKIVSGLDAYSIAANILTMFEIDEITTKGQIKIPQEISQFLRGMMTDIHTAFYQNLGNAFEGKIKTTADIEWPNRILIDKLFPKYSERSLAGKTIVDFYSFNNEIKYQIDNPAAVSPLLVPPDTVKNHEQYLAWLNYKNIRQQNDIDNINENYEKFEESVEWQVT